MKQVWNGAEKSFSPVVHGHLLSQWVGVWVCVGGCVCVWMEAQAPPVFQMWTLTSLLAIPVSIQAHLRVVGHTDCCYTLGLILLTCLVKPGGDPSVLGSLWQTLSCLIWMRQQERAEQPGAVCQIRPTVAGVGIITNNWFKLVITWS